MIRQYSYIYQDGVSNVYVSCIRACAADFPYIPSTGVKKNVYRFMAIFECDMFGLSAREPHISGE